MREMRCSAGLGALLSIPLLAVLSSALAQPAPVAPAWADALREAASARTPLAVLVTTRWEGLCARTRREVLPSRDVHDALAHLAFLEIDLDASPSTLLDLGFAHEALPALAVLTCEGTVAFRVQGYLDPPAFARALAQGMDAAQRMMHAQSTLRLAPDDVPARLDLATILLALPDADRAEPLLRGVLDAPPDVAPAAARVEAAFRLADCALLRGDFDRALALLTDALERDPANAAGWVDSALVARGKILLSRGDLDAGERDLLRAVREFEEGPAVHEALFYLALVRIEREDEAGARDWLAKLALRFPDAPRTHEARARWPALTPPATGP